MASAQGAGIKRKNIVRLMAISQSQEFMLTEQCKSFIDDNGMDLFRDILMQFDSFLSAKRFYKNEIIFTDDFLANLFVGFVGGWVCGIGSTRSGMHW